MPLSDYLFVEGSSVLTGAQGDNAVAFSKGEDVTDTGGSSFVFESGVGISGGVFEIGDEEVNKDEFYFFADGSTFEAGTYTIAVEGRGYRFDEAPDEYFCDVADPTGDIGWIQAPCNKFEDDQKTGNDSVIIDDFDGDGDDDTIYGIALVYPGAKYDLQGNDAVPQTDIFTNKTLTGSDSAGSGEITLSQDGKIGIKFMDTFYSDNSAQLTYRIAR